MGGKQLKFYLHNEDLGKMEKFLEANGYKMFYSPLAKAEEVGLKFKSSLSNTRYLVLEEHISTVMENLTVVPVYLPLVEYKVTYCEGNNLIAGRLFFNSKKYENGEWKQQPQEFVEKSELFFKWFKRTFKKDKGRNFAGAYMSDIWVV